MASRKLGVHGKDLPALVPAVAGDAAINTAGMVFLSERGPAEVKEVTSAPEWAKIFGGYVKGFYGKYEAEGFFQNLQGVDGTLFCRRYVPADASAAYAMLQNGDSVDSLKLSAAFLGALDKGSHGKKVLYTVLHSNRVEDTLVAAADIGAVKLYVNGAVNFEVGDHIIINNGAEFETKEIISKDESENSLTVSALTKSFAVTPQAGFQRWGFSVAKTAASLAGLAAGTYTATITIDGVAIPVSVTAAGSETIQQIIDEIQADVGAAGVVSFDAVGNGFIKVLSATTGLTSTVSISDTDLFAGLTDVLGTPETAVPGEESSSVKTLNFDLAIYRKNSVGVIELQENWTFLSMSPLVSTYVERVLNNQYSGSMQLLGEDQSAPVTVDHFNLLPVEVALPVALDQGGVDGTLPGNSDWNTLLAEFDVKDIRHLCNPESITKTVNDYGEAYCKGRGDCIWYSNLQGNQTYAELLITGQQYVVSNDSYRMNNNGWLEISDPIGVGVEPTIYVPNVGFIMGSVIYWISKHGYQRVPAGVQESLRGVLGIWGDQVLDDVKRTKLADLGINLIQFVPGSGICLRNGRMGSTNKAYKWYNQIFMRLYYKVTFQQSFQEIENEETGEALLTKLFNAVRSYMLVDYNGTSARTGKKSAFLRMTGGKFEDVVTIICDASNNTKEDVLAGNVNVHLYFTPPPPAESIEIGVGISLQIKSAAA